MVYWEIEEEDGEEEKTFGVFLGLECGSWIGDELPGSTEALVPDCTNMVLPAYLQVNHIVLTVMEP